MQIDVLKEVGCIDTDLVVQIKGRVACEMNSGEEMICTECLFENQLENLEPEEAVALMSAFVFQQKNASEPTLTPKLQQARQRFLFSLSICYTGTTSKPGYSYLERSFLYGYHFDHWMVCSYPCEN